MTVTNKTIYLIDGSSYLFRAYYALPPLTNSAGMATGAIYGIVNMLKKFVADYKVEYMLVVFDSKGENFRHKIYPEYKANRGTMPDDLAEQIEPLYQVLTALGYPILKKTGVEADDIIATFTTQANQYKLPVVISSLDKDLAQLVTKDVLLVDTMKNITYDINGVEKKYGVKPELILDYLALMGDASDNIIGIPGVGPKTAVKWLKQYKSLQNIIKNKNEFSGKVGDNLREHIDNLTLNKKIISLLANVELPNNLNKKNLADFLKYLKLNNININSAKELFTKLEFKNWLKELEKHNNSDNNLNNTTKYKYQAILTEADLNKLINKLNKAKSFCFDCETTSLDPHTAKLVGIAFAVDNKTGYYIPLAHDYENAPNQLDIDKVLKKLKLIFNDKNKLKIAQNFKYDLNILSRYNISMGEDIADTMLMSYVLNSSATRHNLAILAKKYLDYDVISYEDVVGKGAKQINFSQVNIALATEYAAEDAVICYSLYQKLLPLLKQNKNLYNIYLNLEIPLVNILHKMEATGILINKACLAKQSQYLSTRLAELTTKAYKYAAQEFNLDSPKQLQEILFTKLKLPITAKTPKGQPSTSEEALKDLANNYALPKIILEYRTLKKLQSTYVDKLPLEVNKISNRIHTTYHQAITVTGRLSSTDPNLQNIPIRTEEGRKIRQAFIAKPGASLISADYSQIELRIMAHLSKDQRLLTAFKNNEDIHTSTASEIFDLPPANITTNQRRFSKAINFGLIYGMSAFGLAKQLGISRSDAQEYINKYFSKYPKIAEYMDKIRALAEKQGFVETIFGRRLYLPNINNKNIILKKAAQRAAINAPMQGSAADIIKQAMILVDKAISKNNLAANLLLQVHDELIIEANDSIIEKTKKILVQSMENSVKLIVPLKISIGVGKNWDQAH